MNTIWALAGVVIKELYRRKDFYVLFVLTALITIATGMVNFFHDPKIVRYVKDICMLLIWVSALLIAIITTARQIPAERESRTIFPLLAKPVTRWQVILGKFLGCWLATGIALAVFYLFFAVITGSREQHWRWLGFVHDVSFQLAIWPWWSRCDCWAPIFLPPRPHPPPPSVSSPSWASFLDEGDVWAQLWPSGKRNHCKASWTQFCFPQYTLGMVKCTPRWHRL